tara:strand:+ start:2910 stop:5054 length:2145 start_codon:yes stop_codon:yes gene_type:complete
MSDLKIIAEELKRNRTSIEQGHDKTSERLQELTNLFGDFIKKSSMTASDDLESKREKKNDRSSLSKIKEMGGSVISGGKSALGGIGGMLAGITGALGGLVKLVGGSALVGLIGLTALNLIDADKIKENVTTLLSIGERYNENTLKTLLSDGAVIVALKTLGTALVFFAAGSAVAAGVNAGIEYFGQGDWAETVKNNVTTLLSIGERYNEGTLKTLFSDGAVIVALTGLGAGLLYFGAGSAVAAGVQKFSEPDWANQVSENVITLLSIPNNFTLGALEMLFDGAGVSAALVGLGVGLAVFGAGGAAAGGALAVGGKDFGKNIRENVNNLLSISDDAGSNISLLLKGGTIVLALTGLGAGLAAFGAGAVVAGGADMLADWFADGTDWTLEVVKNVQNLLSIASLENVGADTAVFLKTMTGIAAGLAVFSIGATVSGISNALSDWISPGEGRGDWTLDTKRRVNNILSIVKENENLEQNANSFAAAMSKIKDGLNAFASGSFVGSLKNAGASIVNFFAGNDSPFENIRMISQEAQGLTVGADAVDRLAISMGKLSDFEFDGSKFKIKDFADDLLEAVPVIEKSIMGGDIRGQRNKVIGEFKGLASSEIDYATAVKNITSLREALNENVSPSPNPVDSSSIATDVADQLKSILISIPPDDTALKQLEVLIDIQRQISGGVVINNISDNSSTSGGSTNVFSGDSPVRTSDILDDISFPQ